MLARFSQAQIDFLREREVCRLATASKDATPQVTPVIYALDVDAFVIAVDYGTKKLANLRENPRASLVVDEYVGDGNQAIMIQGACAVIERGPEYLRLLHILFERFEYYREHPWSEGEAPILRIVPEKIVAWGVA